MAEGDEGGAGGEAEAVVSKIKKKLVDFDEY